MKKVYFKGYINYKNDNYTFSYNNGRLELIKVKHTLSPINQYIYIDYLKGFTIDGFDIIFYINKKCHFWNESYTCMPQIIFVSNDSSMNLSDSKFDSLCFIGGSINRFYSNRNMIKLKDDVELSQGIEFEFKSPEETKISEKATIDGINLEFELSNVKPGWRDDGIFTFDEYNSMLRLKYDKSISIEALVPNIISIQKLMQFCSNRKIITFNTVHIESKNIDGKFEKKVLVFIPPIEDNEINKYMIEYDTISGNINQIFEYFNKSEYVLENIPRDNKEFNIISNKDFSSSVSCFQATYNIVNANKNVDSSNEELNELKLELQKLFDNLNQKYTGVSSRKRKYLSRFNHIIQSSDLKIENILISEIKEHDYLLECLNYKFRDKINELGIEASCEQSISKRDDITHEDLVELNEIDVGIYFLIVKLNYIMILEYCNVDKEKIKKCIEHLSIREII